MELTAVLTPGENGLHDAFNPETGAIASGTTVDEALENLARVTSQAIEKDPRSVKGPVLVTSLRVPSEAEHAAYVPGSPTVLSWGQKRALAGLLHHAFVMLRSPGYGYFWRGKEGWNDPAQVRAALERSIAFGEALHNLPGDIFGETFNFDFHLAKVSAYVQQCPDLEFVIDEMTQIRDMHRPAAPEDVD